MHDAGIEFNTTAFLLRPNVTSRPVAKLASRLPLRSICLVPDVWATLNIGHVQNSSRRIPRGKPRDTEYDDVDLRLWCF